MDCFSVSGEACSFFTTFSFMVRLECCTNFSESTLSTYSLDSKKKKAWQSLYHLCHFQDSPGFLSAR